MSPISVKWQHRGLFRRFSVSTPTYEEVLKKMTLVVPEFDGKFGWKDSDGDLIVVGSTMELQEALRVMAANGADGLLRLFSLQTEADAVLNRPRVEEKQVAKLEEVKKEEKYDNSPRLFAPTSGAQGRPLPAEFATHSSLIRRRRSHRSALPVPQLDNIQKYYTNDYMAQQSQWETMTQPEYLRY